MRNPKLNMISYDDAVSSIGKISDIQWEDEIVMRFFMEYEGEDDIADAVALAVEVLDDLSADDWWLLVNHVYNHYTEELMNQVDSLRCAVKNVIRDIFAQKARQLALYAVAGWSCPDDFSVMPDSVWTSLCKMVDSYGDKIVNVSANDLMTKTQEILALSRTYQPRNELFDNLCKLKDSIYPPDVEDEDEFQAWENGTITISYTDGNGVVRASASMGTWADYVESVRGLCSEIMALEFEDKPEFNYSC